VNIDKKKHIQSYLQKYIELKFPDIQMQKNKLFDCPFKEEHRNNDSNPTCQISPEHDYQLKCFHESHGTIGDVFAIVRKVEPAMASLSDDDIGEYLVHLLDIQTNEEIEKLFNLYSNSKFKLFPCQSGHQDTKANPRGADDNKKPVSGVSWLKAVSDNLAQWWEWHDAKLNFALALGEVSGCVALDIDSDVTMQTMKGRVGETATQKTARGYHFLYQYEEWMKDVTHINFRKTGYDMGLRANHAYIIVAPSSVRGEKRVWNNQRIIKMSEELKALFLDLISKTKSNSPKASDSEKLENTHLSGDLIGLEGICNSTFTQMGGLLSKTMPLKYVEKSLLTFNRLLKEPMQFTDVKRMMYQIKKYRSYDKQELLEELLEHLNVVEQSTSRDLQASLGHEKKDIEEVLKYLVDEGKVIKHRNIYRITNDVEWEEDFMTVSSPLPFTVPFFDEYARFSNGSLIVLGAKTGQGKTHICCNLIKRFVEQGIYPHLLCTEAESKFGIISATLGLKVGDYAFKLVRDPSNIELKDKTVTIIDWLKAPESDYTKMESIYERLNEQLRKHKGILIVLAQLKSESGKFYAEDMTEFYASFVAKYFWTPIKNANGEVYDYDSENTVFKTQKIRDSKSGKQHIIIPTRYSMENKTLTVRKGR